MSMLMSIYVYLSMLDYDQKKDLNKSETLSTRCVQRQKAENSCVISPYANVQRGFFLSFLHKFAVTVL